MARKQTRDLLLVMLAGLALFWSITFYQFYSSFVETEVASELALTATETWGVLLLGFSGGLVILWIYLIARGKR